MIQRISFVFDNGVKVEIHQRNSAVNKLAVLAFKNNELIYEDLLFDPHDLSTLLFQLQVKAIEDFSIEVCEKEKKSK